MKKLALSFLILIFSSSILFSQNDSTKWFKKFHFGVVLNNYNYTESNSYSKNFGIVGIGGTLGYDKVFVEAGYVFGYDYSKKNSKKTVQKPEGAFLKGVLYPINKSKIRIGFGGYLSIYHYTLNYKNYLGVNQDFKFVSGNRKIFAAIDYKIYSKLLLLGEVHFGEYGADNFSISSHIDDGYRSRNIGLNIGIKYLFF